MSTPDPNRNQSQQGTGAQKSTSPLDRYTVAAKSPNDNEEKSAYYTPTAPAITLPKGGGALKGIDEKFTVNAVNGTAGLQVALPLTPGRNGFTPALSLSYNSGSGNSEFGLGWSLSLSSIQRKTDKRLPQYNDADESDVFLLSGMEDLQPYLIYNGMSGLWEPVVDNITEGANHYLVKRYRPRTEGAYALIEFVTQQEGGSWWKVTTKDNIVTWYGLSAPCRLSDPSDARRTFRWLPQVSYDNKGNVHMYIYYTDDETSSIPLSLHEYNRINDNAPFTNVYLKNIYYCNKTPYTVPGTAKYDISAFMPDASDFLMQAVMDYGDHSSDTPTPVPDLPMPYRKDPFSDFHACFEIRTYRRCIRVLMFHFFDELDSHGTLVRSLDMVYNNSSSATGYTEVDYIISISQSGYQLNGSGGYYKKTLPPLELSYQPLVWDNTLHNVSPQDIENAPQGLTGNYQWIDLWGEGLPGILTEQADAWYYKRNLGDGHFTPAMTIAEKPSFQGLGSIMQWQDLDADGRRQLVSRGGAVQGYFELNDEQEWESFRAFRKNVNIDWSSPFTKMLDLNGDGRPDILITEERAWRWYENEGTEGIANGGNGPVFYDEEKGPRLLLNDAVQVIFLADMNGDGLTDLVRIQNGEVCYWPNMGYGRFGARVTMTDSPWFTSPDLFDPQYIALADISGTGAPDIVYIGQEKYTAWRNLAGNAWSKPIDIAPVPASEPYSRVTVADFLGNGTACIIWSSPLPHQAWAPMRYIDLMGGKKPYLMVGYNTGMGKTVALTYKQSTKYYLEDMRAGHPWATRLPFPVHCVSKITTSDSVSQTSYTQLYSYHHGYYDHPEREFRGFGRVDTMDTDTATAFDPGGGTENDLDQSPIKTKTWYHTGAWMQENTLLDAFAAEYFPLGWAEVPLNPDILPPVETAGYELSAIERREAYRALRGQPLRQEVYALDGSLLEETPYTVATYAYCIQQVQPKNNSKYSVCRSYQQQALTYTCERNTTDPRVMHELALETDLYGNILKSAKVSYPRAFTPSPLPPAQVIEVQARMLIAYTAIRYTNDILSDAYHLRVPCEVWTGEVTGISPAATLWTCPELLTAISGASVIDYTDVADGSSPQLRLLGTDRTLFQSNDVSSVLDLGIIESLAIPFQQYKLAFVEKIFSDSAYYNGVMSSPAMVEDAGYLVTASIPQFPADSGNIYWLPSGYVQYDTAHFFVPVGYVDPWGATTTVTYWNTSHNYYLLPDQVTDAIGNAMTVQAYNWYNMQPTRIMDANKNISTMLYDCLGMPVAMALMGKDDGTEGDTLDGIDPNSGGDIDNQALFFNDPLAAAGSLLMNATWRTVYDLSASPVAVGMIAREFHYYGSHPAPVPPEDNGMLIRLTYTDGLGRIAMHKVQAAPEEGSSTIRWIGSGKTVYNNKGNVVMQYEPYYSDNPHYDGAEQAAEAGVTVRMHYDPLNRVIRADMPDGSYTKTEWDNWTQIIYDSNDTVLTSQWYTDAMAGTPEQQDAAEKAARHDDTPTTMYLDTLARPCFTIQYNRVPDGSPVWADEFYHTYAELDITGNRRAVYDTRGLAAATPFPAITWSYNPLGAPVQQVSMDSGTNYTVITADNQPFCAWDPDDRFFRNEYDVLRRPWMNKVTSGIPVTTRVLELMEYGESAGAPTANNLNGRLYKVYDGAGLQTTPAYDFSGNPLSTERQFTRDPTFAPDWTTPGAVGLEATVYTTSITYDALGRPIAVITPDGAVTTSSYNLTGLPFGTSVAGVHSLSSDIVNETYYDAKGQMLKAKYENGTTTLYTYDPDTFRVTGIRMLRNSDSAVLQDLKYWYDPVGNITQQHDDAQQDVYFDGTVATPGNDYTYDALYRLVIAGGRELAGNDGAPNYSDRFRTGITPEPVSPANTAAMRPYIQYYTYDGVGNMLSTKHTTTGGTGNWTRDFTIDTTSNRLLQNSIGSNNPVAENYSYDNRGNLTGGMNHLLSMSYNAANRLEQVIVNSTINTYYQYDMQGQRVRKYVQDTGGNITQERKYVGQWEVYRKADTSTGTLLLERETLKAGSCIIDTPIVQPSGGGEMQLMRYQYTNHLGTATLELTDKADVISYEEYYSYGSTSFQSGRTGAEVGLKRYRYIGKERDEETGFYYMGARYYASWICRWIAVDPLQSQYTPQSPFVYCSNNPIGRIDETGMGDEGGNEKLTGEDLLRPPLESHFEVNDFGMLVKIYDLPSVTVSAQTQVNPDQFSLAIGVALMLSYKEEYGFNNFPNADTISKMGEYLDKTQMSILGNFDGNNRNDRMHRYVNENSLFLIYDSTLKSEDFSYFMLMNFMNGNGPENYLFPMDGNIAKELGQGSQIQGALLGWAEKNSSSLLKGNFNDTKDYRYNSSYGFVANVQDFINFGNLTNVPNYVGSASITVSSFNEDHVLVSIFNVTSITSGNISKHFNGANPPSDPRNLEKPLPQPYSNISQTFYITFDTKEIAKHYWYYRSWGTWTNVK